jgi:hypothetical protein
MKNYSTMSDVDRRIQSLNTTPDFQQAFITVADTFDNANLLAKQWFGENVTCADVIRITEMMLREERNIKGEK